MWQLELEKNGDENHSYLSPVDGLLCHLESMIHWKRHLLSTYVILWGVDEISESEKKNQVN